MLSDVAIRRALSHDDADRRLVVCPMLDAEQIGSASIDLRLGTEFMEVLASVGDFHSQRCTGCGGERVG